MKNVLSLLDRVGDEFPLHPQQRSRCYNWNARVSHPQHYPILGRFRQNHFVTGRNNCGAASGKKSDDRRHTGSSVEGAIPHFWKNARRRIHAGRRRRPVNGGAVGAVQPSWSDYRQGRSERPRNAADHVVGHQVAGTRGVDWRRNDRPHHRQLFCRPVGPAAHPSDDEPAAAAATATTGCSDGLCRWETEDVRRWSQWRARPRPRATVETLFLSVPWGKYTTKQKVKNKTTAKLHFLLHSTVCLPLSLSPSPTRLRVPTTTTSESVRIGRVSSANGEEDTEELDFKMCGCVSVRWVSLPWRQLHHPPSHVLPCISPPYTLRGTWRDRTVCWTLCFRSF